MCTITGTLTKLLAACRIDCYWSFAFWMYFYSILTTCSSSW